MADQEFSSNHHGVTIQLEIVPENEQDADPAAVEEVGRSLVEVLRKNGFAVQPVYTGERGGFLFDIVSFFQTTVQIVVIHKDLLVEMFKVASPIAKHFIEEGEKHFAKDAAQGYIKVEIGIGGDYIQAEASDLAGDEQVIKLANTFLARYPRASTEVTSPGRVKVRGYVPKRQIRRRR